MNKPFDFAKWMIFHQFVVHQFHFSLIVRPFVQILAGKWSRKTEESNNKRVQRRSAMKRQRIIQADRHKSPRIRQLYRVPSDSLLKLLWRYRKLPTVFEVH